MTRIAIISSHPIQYNAPLFKEMSEVEGIILKVFYTVGKENFGNDAGFNQKIDWDIPLFERYEHEFLDNISRHPGLGKFGGIRNPHILDRIELYKPDIVWVYGWNYLSHLVVMRHFSGKIPVWFRGDSTLLDEKTGLKKVLRRLFLRWVYRHIDKALYVGQANKAYFRIHGVGEDQMVFVPHAVDNDHFYDSSEKKFEEKAGQWRKELGIPVDAVVFLYAGKFIPKKNPLLLIKAFKQLNLSALQPVNSLTQHSVSPSPRFPVYLILVGNGPLESKLKKEAANHPSIIFLPFQNQSRMPVVYRLGDVFVLPSKGPGETWGLALNEAMACSRTIIASDKVGSASDLIREGINGFTFTSGDQHSLINVMQKIRMSDLKKIGENSRNMVEEWSYNVVLEAFRNLLK